MAAIQHEFYRSFRGPGAADEDWWSLVFDPETRRLLVRHDWQASGHGGFDDLDVTEFLVQSGGAQTALIDSLFRVPADAGSRKIRPDCLAPPRPGAGTLMLRGIRSIRPACIPPDPR